MNLKSLRLHCLAKPGVTEEHPFGPGALVMKVGRKIFAIIGEGEEPLTVSIKCEPERSNHDSVQPGYHLNKRHWNTVTLDGSIDDRHVLQWVDDSYDLVRDGLPSEDPRSDLRSQGRSVRRITAHDHRPPSPTSHHVLGE